MEFNKSQPIYIQLTDSIKHDIVSGNLKAGDKLPSIREYAEKALVNPNTVQKAFAELELKEYIFSKRGIGYFVNEDEKFVSDLRISYLDKKIDQFINSLSDLDYPKEIIREKMKEKLW